METDRLVATACERAGADDLGGDTWREGLEVLVHSLNTEAALNEMGVGAMTDQIVGYLVNRLLIERWYAEHPEIDDQQIVAPLFGLGLPRTGSTALSFLLAQDPSRRSLRVWEAAEPCPPPETATEHTDPRIARAQAGIDFTNEMFTGFAGMLPTAADGPQECLLPMALEFRSLIFEGMALIPSYSAWLLRCDMEPAYRYHRAGAEAVAVALPARPVVAEDPGPHAVDRRPECGVPRCPVCHDPPRCGQGAPVGVRAVQHPEHHPHRASRPGRHR